MGMLPVPEEVKHMHEKIDRLLDSLQVQNRLLDRLLERADESKAQSKAIEEVQRKLVEIGNALAIISDIVRLNKVA